MKVLGTFLAFLAILILGTFAIGFTDTVQTPVNETAAAQYTNLTKVIDISSVGIQGTMLILIAVMVLSAMMFMYYSLIKK